VKKAIKIIAIAAGSVVVLLVIAAVALPLLIDPNRYRDDIVGAVKAATGRDLRIEDKLGWSVFPRLGIKTGRVELANAAGFGKEPFARVEAAGVSVEWLPLFAGKVRVDTFHLDGLALNLARNAAGKSNWDDLGGAPAKKPAPETAETGKPPAALAMLAVNGIEVRKATVTWRDQASGAHYALRNLELRTGAVAVNEPVDVALAFDIESGKPAVRSRLDLKSRLSVDPVRQTLDIPSLALALDDLKINASVKGTKIMDAPSFAGTLEVASFNARALMNKLGVKLEAADPAALTRTALKASFAHSPAGTAVKDLQATLDDTRITGTLELRNAPATAYRVDLALDEIDLDRYLAPPAAPKGESGKAAPAPAPVEIPLGGLRRLDVQGKLAVGKLKVMNLRSENIRVQLSAKDGLIRLGPNSARLYGGTYAGRTTLDARPATPKIQMEEQLTGIQLGPFLKDAGIFDKFSGESELKLALTAQGLDADAVKRTLNGTVSVAALNGKIEGVDLQKIIADARRLRDTARGRTVTVEAAPSDETAFSSLRAHIRVTNGLASTDDLALEGPVVRARGQGKADLVKETLDARLQVTLAEGAERKGTTVPLVIGGTFARPSYGVDFGEVVKEQVEKKLEQKLEQKLDRLFKKR
jgi:AsmA protein